MRNQPDVGERDCTEDGNDGPGQLRTEPRLLGKKCGPSIVVVSVKMSLSGSIRLTVCSWRRSDGRTPCRYLTIVRRPGGTRNQALQPLKKTA